MATFVALPVRGELPRELFGQTLYQQVESVIDLTGLPSAGKLPQAPKTGKSGKGKTEFSFDKALQGIKSEAGGACASKGDGSFQDGSNILRQGNVVHLSPNALKGENAEQTLARLDAMQKGVRQPPAPSSSSSIPDVGSLANILNHATNMGPPSRSNQAKVHYQHVHDAVKHLLDELQEDYDSSGKGTTWASVPAGVGACAQLQGSGGALILPLPTHNVVELDDRLDVIIDLPGVQSPDEAQVDIGKQMLIVTVPGMYRVLKVDLPRAVSDSQSKAKWSKKKKQLTVQLAYLNT